MMHRRKTKPNRNDEDDDSVWKRIKILTPIIAAIIALVGTIAAAYIYVYEPIRAAHSIQVTPTHYVGSINFDAGPTGKLNPQLKWDAGSAEASKFTIHSGTLDLVAGPRSWPLFPSITGVQQIQGDFETQIEVSLNSSSSSLEGNAQMAGLIVRPVGDRLVFDARNFPDNWVVNVIGVGDAGGVIGCWPQFVSYSDPQMHVYLRIERISEKWRCAYSSNGINWIWLDSRYSGSLTDRVEIAIYAHSTTENSVSATFKDWYINK